MKQYTTRFLKSVAVFYLAFPVAYVLIAAVMFDIAAAQCLRILLSPSYYFVSLMAVAVGYGLWEMKRWAWYILIVVNILTGYLNAIFANDYGESHHKALAFVASILGLAIITYRVAREIRVPYFFPKIRWWESNPRYRLSVPVKIFRETSAAVPSGPVPATEIAGEILDISAGGCFIKLRSELKQDEKVNLNFTVFGQAVECEGVIVWRTRSTVTHPKGVGVKFNVVTRAQRRTLRVVNQRLRKIAAFYRSSRYLLSQEEFIKRLEQLESEQADTKRARTG